MEHRKKGRKLKRTASHKRALLSNLCISLIKHKRIITTLAKAKELRLYVEPLITKAKKANAKGENIPSAYVHYAREIRKFLKDKEAINILLKEIGPKVLERNGGYTRVLKSGFRVGDGGAEAIIELVDFGIAEKPKAGSKTSGTKDEKPAGSKTAPKKSAKTSETKEAPAKKKTTAKKEPSGEKTAKKTAAKKTETAKPKEKAVKKTATKKKKEE